MKAGKFTLILVLLVGIWASLYANPKEGSTKPNILIIFTDDQGYGDMGCYGNQTNLMPRLDRLAKEGTRFTSFTPSLYAGCPVQHC